MQSVTVLIKEVENVKKLNRAVCSLDFEVDVRTTDEKHCLDAKSLMGLFSLDLEKPVKLVCNDVNELERLKEVVKDFIV